MAAYLTPKESDTAFTVEPHSVIVNATIKANNFELKTTL